MVPVDGSYGSLVPLCYLWVEETWAALGNLISRIHKTGGKYGPGLQSRPWIEMGHIWVVHSSVSVQYQKGAVLLPLMDMWVEDTHKK